MQSDYEFRSEDGGKTWTRHCFGVEKLLCFTSEKTPGFGMLTGGYVVSFPRSVPAVDLRVPLEAAWIRLRAATPVVAYKTKDAKKDEDSNPGYAFYFEYTVPEDADAVRTWAAETIIWHEDRVPLRERDIAMKNLWWRATDEKYNYELHVAPDVDTNKWQILIHSVHWSSDVRGTLQLSELFFTYLDEYLVQGLEPSLEIKWGEETKKLAPPMAIAGALASGLPADMLFHKPPVAHTEEMPESKDSAYSEGNVEKKQHTENGVAPSQILFLRPTPLVEESPKYDAAATDLWLSHEETLLFRAACKRHGVTVTQALTAFGTVAEVEWALTHDEGRSAEEQKQIVETYEDATHFPFPCNYVDYRPKLREYARHDSPKGSVPIAAEGFPIMIDMAKVRQVVKYNKDTGEIKRDTSEEGFWNVIAKHSRELWKSGPSDLAACLGREIMSNAFCTMLDPTAYMVPAIMGSSVGDIESIGLLTEFSPSNPNPKAQDRLLVEQVSVGVRCPTPVKIMMSWQWNGRLLIRPQTSSRWTSQKGLDKMVHILREWMEEACLIR